MNKIKSMNNKDNNSKLIVDIVIEARISKIRHLRKRQVGLSLPSSQRPLASLATVCAIHTVYQVSLRKRLLNKVVTLVDSLARNLRTV